MQKIWHINTNIIIAKPVRMNIIMNTIMNTIMNMSTTTSTTYGCNFLS